jgi:hypothetical protein
MDDLFVALHETGYKPPKRLMVHCGQFFIAEGRAVRDRKDNPAGCEGKRFAHF